MSWRRLRVGLVALLVLAVTPALAQKGPKKLKPGFNLFSQEQDVELGKEAAAEIEKQITLVNDADIVNYVNRIGQRLAQQPGAEKYPYTFKVVNDDAINAFALPGGPLYINTGLIKAADNESQIAGVLGHEIAHVALRHGTNQVSKANLIQLPAMIGGAMLGGDGSILGTLAQLGIGVGAQSLLLKYSRNAETDADILGVRIASGAGYNPIEMARFFEKLQADGGGGRLATWFSSHPNPANRSKTIEQEIQYLGRQSYTADSGQLPRVKQLVAQVPAAPKKPQQASGAGGGTQQPGGQQPTLQRPDPRTVDPVARFKTHRAQNFQISYPENWELFQDQQGQGMTIAPRAGLANSGQGVAIGYGVMIGLHQVRHQRPTLESATEELIQVFRQGNPQLQMGNSRPNRTKVDGSDSMIVELTSPSIYGGAETDTLVTIARPEGLLYLVFVAPQSDFSRIQPAFAEMLRSVRFTNQ